MTTRFPIELRTHAHLVMTVKDDAGAVAIVTQLEGLGIAREQISVLALVSGASEREALAAAHEGRTELRGAAVGGTLGLLAGLGLFAVPGLGATLLAAGPVVMAVNVLGHSIAGGLGLGMLVGAILDEKTTEAHRDAFRERLEQGDRLVILHGERLTLELAATQVHGESLETVELF